MAGSFSATLRAAGDSLAAGARRAAGCILPTALAVWFALLFFVVAVATAAVGGYFYLTLTIPSYGAMLIVAGGARVLSIICGLAAWGLASPGRASSTSADREGTGPTEASVSDMASIVEREARQAVEGNAKNAALISLVAGITLGISPELRRALFKFLTK